MLAGDPMSPFGGPLAKDRESRLVGALRSEVRSMREERLELEAGASTRPLFGLT